MRRLFVPVILIAGLLTAAPARAASITFESATVNPNDSFVVSILLDDVTDLIAFNFDFAFDPTVVGTPTVTRGNIFAGVGEPCDECFFSGFPPDPVAGTPGLVSFYRGHHPWPGGRHRRRNARRADVPGSGRRR